MSDHQKLDYCITVLLDYMYGDKCLSSLHDALHILAAIIPTWDPPLKTHQQQILCNVVLPLYKRHIPSETQPILLHCVINFLKKEKYLASVAVKELIRIWPKASVKQEIMFLHAMKEIFILSKVSEDEQVLKLFLNKIGMCISSPASVVSKRAIKLLSNICNMMNSRSTIIISSTFSILYRTSTVHWNQDVVDGVCDLLDNFLKHSPVLFDQLFEVYKSENVSDLAK